MIVYEPSSCAVVYIDEALVVVDKPHGLPSVPGRAAGLQDCAFSRLLRECPDARVVHRLDMATSGLLLFARGAAHQAALSRAFARREVSKQYVAEVHGVPDRAGGTIDLPLRADWPQRPGQMVDRVAGKPSITSWRRLVASLPAGRSRLELKPLTGRSHQLRVHLQAIGHPIVGDRLYGPPNDDATQRMLLHASALSFVHPGNGQLLELTSPVPF